MRESYSSSLGLVEIGYLAIPMPRMVLRTEEVGAETIQTEWMKVEPKEVDFWMQGMVFVLLFTLHHLFGLVSVTNKVT